MRTTILASVVVLFMASAVGWTQQEKDDKKQPKPDTRRPSVWMKVKLKSSEGILRGLTLGDFDLIEENAQRMSNFGRLEKIAHARNPEYQTQLRFLEHANSELIRQAKKRNLDGATLAFVQLTTSCVNCHRAIRKGEHEAGKSLKPTGHLWTHRVRLETEYYLTGPQQGRPADGKLAEGAKVVHIKAHGSYCKVRTEAGDAVFVACDALEPRKK
ncbi:MAG: hypothetical protein MI757_01605 [Pirellulales bacterium]|nr:hypothetical protein [Pirellulales bacterium]